MDTKLLIIVLLLFSVSELHAQDTITGTVTDASSDEPLPAVNISVKGTTVGTSTNTEGEYKLSVKSLSDTLRFSFVGYETLEVIIEGRTTISVAMKPSTFSAEELVVVGYGQQKKETLTGSVSTVDSDELIQESATDPAQMIRGKVPGLSINKLGSNPAEGYTLKLRGIGTLAGDASPLVIIDGVEGSLSDVSPQDIESLNVIKDASASAIYGTRGANGVVIVKTKQAEKGNPIFRLNSYVSTEKATQKLPVLSAAEYRELIDQGIEGATDYGGSTDWPNQIVRDSPFSQVTNLTLSTGNDQTSYIANLSYDRLEGIVKRSNNNVLNGRFQINHSMYDGKLDFTGNIILAKEWRYDGSEGEGSFNGRILRDALAFNPTRPIKDEDGSYNQNADNNTENPVSILNETNGEYQQQKGKLFGNVQYSPIQNLTLKVQGSRLSIDGLEGFAQTKLNGFSVQNGLNGYASRLSDKVVETIFNSTAEYKDSFNKNNFTLLAGYTWKEHVEEGFSTSNYDFPTDKVEYNNLGNGLALSDGQASENSYKQQSNLLGYFARLNYDYGNKYLLTASFRREASSKFGANNKWGLFPAFSVGWNITQESFMDNIAALNNLKIRFGFGITGSEPTNPYQSLSRLSFGNKYLYNSQWVSTVQPLNNPNPDLKWEEKKEYNFGLDFAMLKNRIDGSLDIYRRRTNNLLYDFTVPVPPYLYDSILANAGTIQNEGIEINLNTKPIQNNYFQWNSTINYSTNRNELISLSNNQYSLGRDYFDVGYTGGPIQKSTHRLEVGKPIGNFYGFKSIGVTEDGFWEIEGDDGNPKSILDQNPDDRQIIGNGVPDFNLSWSNTLNYANWDLRLTMSGAFGFQILNLRRMFYNVPTQVKGGNVMKRTFDPVYGDRPLSVDQSKQYVSYFIEDGDYWKIDNMTIGYNFNVDNLGVLNRARLYASVDNLYTFTGYSGFDPEVNFAGLTPGFDNKDRYPTNRKFTLGISLTF